MGRPAIFMDRDGTLSHEVGYVNHLSRFRLLPYGRWTRCGSSTASGWLAVAGHEPGRGRARLLSRSRLIHEVHASLRARHGRGRRPPRRHLLLPAPPVGRRAALPSGLRLPQAAARPAAAGGGGARRRPRALLGDRRPARRSRSSPGRSGARARPREDRLRPGRAGLRRAARWPRPPDLVAENVLEAVERILAAGEDAA